MQRYVLVRLMINADALPFKLFGSLKADKRKDLVDRGYVVATERPITLDLTQKGHDRAVDELAAEPPERAGTAGETLYATLDFIRRLLKHSGTEPKDLFRLRLATSRPIVAPEPASDEIAEGTDLAHDIRAAYNNLAPRPGDYIALAALRAALEGVSDPQIDAALIDLNRAPDVHLVPESNQKTLTAEQRAAAVSIGNQDKHLLAIGL
ncbi:hypothetical protein LADH09A_005436 [Micromonospora sp. LAH09]|uniref:hypothetical protein n=1 Tax=Micromonospora cabrerizensis TaxID=2911213 RepID=UPI001EE7ABC3|nr:hypothetical protein [Micromonospora cabrerizensis]MCG5471443.1 hypothetical protein [Micromonospora cabrerizensis]